MKKLYFLPLLFVFAFALGGCDLTENPEETFEPSDREARLEAIMDLIERNHYSQPQREAMIDGAIEGLIDALDDPYTNHFSQEEYEQFQDSMGEEFVGVGITVENRDNDVVVQNIWPDSPAERAGLRVGDVITHVDGESVEALSYFETVPKVQGEEGTEVEFGVDRPGEGDTLYFTMPRETIPNPTVEASTFDDDGKTIGMIRVNAFGDETYQRFASELSELEETGIDGLMIDLRNNGGGRLDTVLNLLNIFLVEDDDKPMFSIEFYQNGEEDRTDFMADGDSAKPYDIVTIINDFSASASEVFAVAMMEHGGYEVVGMESFGKGTMQSPFSHGTMGDDELHLSNGIWLTSEGNWINAEGGDYPGVMPTIPVERTTLFDIAGPHLRGDDTFAFDSVSHHVEMTQIILNGLYDSELREDGYFDEATEAALENFQEDEGLSVTGELDGDTAQALNEVLFEYTQDSANDEKIQAALQYLLNNQD